MPQGAGPPAERAAERAARECPGRPAPARIRPRSGPGGAKDDRVQVASGESAGGFACRGESVTPADIGKGGSAALERIVRSIRSAGIQKGLDSAQLGGDPERRHAKFSLAPPSIGWAVESHHHMGDAGASSFAPSSSYRTALLGGLFLA